MFVSFFETNCMFFAQFAFFCLCIIFDICVSICMCFVGSVVCMFFLLFLKWDCMFFGALFVFFLKHGVCMFLSLVGFHVFGQHCLHVFVCLIDSLIDRCLFALFLWTDSLQLFRKHCLFVSFVSGLHCFSEALLACICLIA